MSDRVDQAVEQGREFLKNSSEAGEDKLQNFIHDQYDNMSPKDFTDLIYGMRGAPENKSSDGSLSVWSEDRNGNGFLEISEIWTVCHGEHEQMQARKGGRDGGANGVSQGSYLERAFDYVMKRNEAVEADY